MFAGVPHRKGRYRTDGDEGNCQSQAERQHYRKSQSELLELETNHQHRERRGTRKQSTRQSKQDELAGRHLPVGEALLDFFGVLLLVRVLKILTRRIVLVMVVMTFRKLGFKSVGVVAMRQLQTQTKLMRLGDVGRGLKNIFHAAERENLPRAIGTDSLDGNCFFIWAWQWSFVPVKEVEPEMRRHVCLKHADLHEAMPGVEQDSSVCAVVMAVVVMMMPGGVTFPARAREHPNRHPNHKDTGCNLKIGFGGFDIESSGIVQSDQGQNPDDGRM